MNTNETLEEVERLSRELQQKFNRQILPYRADVWRFCSLLTGSPWDAEDLLQETLMKAYGILPQLWQPLNPKSYLFRIASNLWIDQCRKRKLDTTSWDVQDETADASSINPVDIWDAVEVLVRDLHPRQAVVVLLVDVFEFRSAEVAQMISTTEGAVKSLLHRARFKLQKERGRPMEVQGSKPDEPVNRMLLDAFVAAYNRRDVGALLSLMDEHTCEDDAPVFQAFGRSQMERTSLADWSRGTDRLIAEPVLLWDRLVIVVNKEAEGKRYLTSIIELSTEDEKIVKWKEFYFSTELLRDAASAFGTEIDTTKELYGNEL